MLREDLVNADITITASVDAECGSSQCARPGGPAPGPRRTSAMPWPWPRRENLRVVCPWAHHCALRPRLRSSSSFCYQSKCCAEARKKHVCSLQSLIANARTKILSAGFIAVFSKDFVFKPSKLRNQRTIILVQTLVINDCKEEACLLSLLPRFHLSTASHFAQMGPHFARNTTPNPFALLSRHTHLSGICRYTKHPQAHPKTALCLA